MVPKIQLIDLRSSRIFLRRNLGDLLKAPPRDYVFETDGGAFLGGIGIG